MATDQPLAQQVNHRIAQRRYGPHQKRSPRLHHVSALSPGSRERLCCTGGRLTSSPLSPHQTDGAVVTLTLLLS
ncbi:hypothetical protein KCP70_00150 [Salmonella enterica subsp. enterica]|nr:hypothetical protein KCP70_00150 [Salmonella enterica subsp. enterica]